MIMEIYKPIVGYEDEYIISNLGNIKNIKTNKLLKQYIQTNGRYFFVSLSKKSIVKTFRVHRLVCITFLPNPENKPDVNHKNCNIFDNRLENLEWCTKSENCKHGFINKRNIPPLNFLGKFGIDHNRSKSFYLVKDNKITFFGSGLEFYRKTGLDHTSISYGRKQIINKNLDKYIFKKGNIAGYQLYLDKSKLPHFELIE